MKRIIIIFLLLTAGFNASADRHRIDSLLKVIKGDIHDTVRVRYYYQIGKDYMNINVDSSQFFIKKSLEYAEKTNFKRLEASSYSALGVGEKNKGNYKEAIQYHLRALKINEANADEKSLAISYNDIGILYKNMQRYTDALPYYRKSNEICRKIGFAKGISLTYNNIGTILRETNHADSALYYYQLALKEAERSEDSYSISTCLANVGDVYIDKGRYQEALDIFMRCLATDKLNEDKLGIALSYAYIGKVSAKLKDYNKAIIYSDSAIALAKQEQLSQDLMEILGVRTEIEMDKGDYKKALEITNQYIALKDSLMGIEANNHISELQTKYDTEKKEHQIALQQSELRKKNYVIAGIIVFLMMGILLAASSYRRYKLRQQAQLQAAVIEQQELATAAVIQAEERERKRIAGDLHDGVGQLMSAAKMNLSMVGSELNFQNEEQKISFDKALDLVDESCREVRTVSHNIMPNALLRSGLASAIREFINKLDQRVIKVNLYIEGMNERISSSIESVLYRVVQESVNNVIKHAGASQLDIALIRDEDGISVTIEDNGKGFDTSDKSKFNGIGIKNIQSRVDYLKGSIEWDSAPGKGTVVTIQVPE